MTARNDNQRTSRLIVIAVALLLVGFAVGWVARGGSTESSTPSSASIGGAAAVTTGDGTSPSASTTGPMRTTVVPATTLASNCSALPDVDTVSVDQLPSQALDTLDLIAADGPFPYDQDGAVFQNRERLLPKRAAGYYHEYTVITPGSPDRGARRIIVGDCGDKWYTEDHYDSFWLIIDA